MFGDVVKELNDPLPFERKERIAEDLNDILEAEVDDAYYMAQGYLDTLKKHKTREKAKGNGFGYVVVNREGIMHPIANTLLATGGSGKERNLVYQPKQGVEGKKLPSKKTPLNNESIRVMTPTEWGRLQGFINYAFLDEKGVDHFSFPPEITRAQQYKQFGNSVTIPVIESMACFMLNCFEIMSKHTNELVINLAKNKEYITKKDIIELLRITPNQANNILKKLKQQRILQPVVGRGRKSNYKLHARLKGVDKK